MTALTAHLRPTERGAILELATDGLVGLGEAAPLPGFTVETPDQVVRQLSSLRLGPLPGSAPAVDRLVTALDLAPTASHAVEQALVDLLAQRRGVPVPSLWCEAPRSHVPTHVLVTDLQDATHAVAAGATALKIKVGRGLPEQDLALLSLVRDAVGPDIALRLDANGRWPFGVALEFLQTASTLGIACVEEPVEGRDLAALGRLRRAQTTPVAADESVRSSADLARLIELDAADILVIKPMFVGGPSAALRLARQASDAGLAVSVTHALESDVGRRSATWVAQAAPGELATCAVGEP